MINRLLMALAVMLIAAAAPAQDRPVLVISPFTTAADVSLPYDLTLLQTQLVAEFKVLLGKELDVVAEPPASPAGSIYTLDAEIVAWRAGNAAKRFLIGMGSGRESMDVQYHVSDSAHKRIVERKDTIRTNYFSQGAGSSGTLAHPVAQKIAERIRDARLR